MIYASRRSDPPPSPPLARLSGRITLPGWSTGAGERVDGERPLRTLGAFSTGAKYRGGQPAIAVIYSQPQYADLHIKLAQ